MLKDFKSLIDIDLFVKLMTTTYIR